MHKNRPLVMLGGMALSACVMTISRGQEEDRAWYLASNKAGIPASEIEPNSVPPQVRQAYRAASIAANTSNSWMVWVNAWPRNGGKDGRVYVESISLEAIADVDSAIPIYTQRYELGDSVWGGWFPYTSELWYKLGMREENAFDVGDYREGNELRFTGAIIDVGARANIPAAGHIWMKCWPRNEAPPSTVRLRLRARFAVTGSAFVNVGMDRYRLCDADPEPVQEMLVSDTYGCEDTYGNEHGIIDVIMETVPITWQP